MKSTHPDQLHPNRVYFTEFDRVTYSQVAWTNEDIEEIKRDLINKLKLQALTKGHVVIAASHLLESELAREIIMPHPELFSEQIIVPALRSEFASCVDFIEAKRNSKLRGEGELYNGTEQNEMAQLIDDAALVVSWDMLDTSKWFKNRLLTDLKNDNSLVALHLQRKSLKVPSALCDELEPESHLSRGLVYNAAQKHGDLEFREIVCAYADFLYYLSGAKAVHSEGILPQENIIDFQISDLEQGKSPLSEHEVFFKVFIDIVKSSTSTHFPTDFLESLTINDSVELHRIASEERFIDKYNAIQERTKAGLQLSDPERLVLLMDEIVEFEQNLHAEFSSTIEHELSHSLRQMKKEQSGNILHTIASLIIFPYSLAIGAKDSIVSGLRIFEKDTVAKQIETRILRGLQALVNLLDLTDVKHKPILLRFVDQLKAQYINKMFG